MIAITDFQKVEMRVGMIVDVQDFPEARNPSYKLQVDFGPFGIKSSSAAVQPWYSKPELLGRRVIAVTNFPPRQIWPFLSEVWCLGAVQSDGRVVLLRPDRAGELGARIACERGGVPRPGMRSPRSCRCYPRPRRRGWPGPG